jgi:hypothetical protein
MPFTDQIGEHFAGRACGSMLDLYVGYDEHSLSETSHNLTTFQSPFGMLRLVTLPMGWTNSVPIFHDNITYILQPEIPETTVPYINDVPICRPATRYLLPDGSKERITKNAGIRRFVWEHFQGLNRVVQCVKYSGGTFSGYKSLLCAEEIMVVGHRCTPQGRLPDQTRIAKIAKWGPCQNLSDVRTFLGTVGMCCIFIQNFSKRTNPLVQLMRKGTPFEFSAAQAAAQDNLKKALLDLLALCSINYTSDSPVILAVDTSPIAIGFYLCQADPVNPWKCYFTRFRSISLNNRKRRFSQPKLELYRLFCALHTYKIFIVGICNLIIEVNERYIKGMLNSPDTVPSASINHWIVSILTFHFKLQHVPGKQHGPNGLLRQPLQIEDNDNDDTGEDPESFDDWVDNLYGFVHLVNPTTTMPRTSQFLHIFVSVCIDDADNPQPPKQEPALDYNIIPRMANTVFADKWLEMVHDWLTFFDRPGDISDCDYNSLTCYTAGFFVDDTGMWRHDDHGAHKCILYRNQRIKAIYAAHDDVGHCGYYATHALVTEQYWWPFLGHDVTWYVCSCHICQTRQTRQIAIPPVVATPAPLFTKMYMDTMHLPRSAGYAYIVQGRCSLTNYPEFCMLRKETVQTLGDWIFQDVLCCWGTLVEIVSDNGKPFVAALSYLEKKYHIKHIHISGYNSCTNGIVKCLHFDIHQALFKAADGDQRCRAQVAHSVFWSEHVTPRKRMGYSLYYAATGTHPILPFDIIEANYLLPPPDSLLATTDLIVQRAIALQKWADDLAQLHDCVFKEHSHATACFE